MPVNEKEALTPTKKPLDVAWGTISCLSCELHGRSTLLPAMAEIVPRARSNRFGCGPDKRPRPGALAFTCMTR